MNNIVILFLTTERKSDETFTLFCSRLRSLFRHYLDSRNVGDNVDKLVSLMVADRLKTEMSASCLKHMKERRPVGLPATGNERHGVQGSTPVSEGCDRYHPLLLP